MLPCQCHTSLLYLVSSLQSFFNVVIEHFQRVMSQALKSSSLLLADVFGESQSLAYTSFGYNTVYSNRHWKRYKEADCVLISFVMLDCAQVRTAILSKRYHVCVLCKNSINLY